MNLSDISKVVAGELIGADLLVSPSEQMPELSTDTRTLGPGSIFIALSGENFDGNKFVSQAEAKGAIAAIVSKPQTELDLPQIKVNDTTEAYGLLANSWRLSLSATVVAITGSCGKTAVKGFLTEILSLAGACYSTPKNFNNQIGVPQTLLAAPKDIDYLIVEAGTSERGEISRLAKIIDADIAVVTNVNPVHLEGLLSLEGIAHEKSDLFSCGQRSPRAVMHASLKQYAVFVDKTQALNCLQYSADSEFGETDLYAKNIRFDAFGCASFELVYGQLSLEIQLNVSGEHQVENALAAAGAAFIADVQPQLIKQGLAAYFGDKRRMQRIQLDSMVLIDDSYNSSPASVRAAIDMLSGFENTVLVLGDMLELGDLSQREHEGVGRYAAAKGIGTLLALGEASAFSAKAFSEGALVFATHQELIDYLSSSDMEGGTVLVKGSRGARMDIVVDGLVKLQGET